MNSLHVILWLRMGYILYSGDILLAGGYTDVLALDSCRVAQVHFVGRLGRPVYFYCHSGYCVTLLEEETTRMALLLGSISKGKQSSPQTGGTRDEPDPSRGTPSLMDTYNKKSSIKHDPHQKHDDRHCPRLTPP